MRFTNVNVKFCLVVALAAMTLFVTKPASTASATASAAVCPACACFPSCPENDGKFLSISGGGLASFVGGSIEIGITSLATDPDGKVTIGIFDPNNSGLWDTPTIDLLFELVADPNNDGTGTTVIATNNSTAAPPGSDENAWWDQDFVNVAPALGPGGNFSYFLRITPTTLNPNDGALNAIKVRTDGTFSLTGQTIQFIAPADEASEFAIIGGIDVNTFQCPIPTTYNGIREFQFQVLPTTIALELWDGDFDFGTNDASAVKDTDDPNTSPVNVCVDTNGPALPNCTNPAIPLWAQGSTAKPEGIAQDAPFGTGVGAPPDDNGLCAFRRSPAVIYSLIGPGGVTYTNSNPSGTSEWEKFSVATTNATNPDITGPIPPGTWTLRIEGMDVFNQFALHFNRFLEPATGCPTCTEPEIVVNTAIKLDASNLAGTAGILAPFTSFDGSTITIDLGNRPLHVTSNGSISVLAGANAQPAQFHKSGSHGTPNLTIKSTCTLLIDESTRGTVNALFRSLTGVIETNAAGGKAGDILLEFDGAIEIKGGVQSFQEKLPDSASSLSGAITIESVCGEIRVGPKGWVVTWGENPGTSPISLIQLGTQNIVVNGLVMNRTNHTLGGNPPPIINVHAVGGSIRIDGSQLVLDEFSLMGTKYDLTSGLLTISRDSSDVGKINIQASTDVVVLRDVIVGALNRTTFAAVATVVNSNSPIGGTIRVRSLNGKITAQGRAFQADGRGNNSSALIELIASGMISMQNPPVLNGGNTPTVTTSAAPVNGVGKAGKNVLRSCTGQVLVDSSASVLATGVSGTGINQFMAAGGVVVLGTASPAFVGGAPACPPTPLF